MFYYQIMGTEKAIRLAFCTGIAISNRETPLDLHQQQQATYMYGLMEDLRMFYAGEKLGPKHPPDHHWVIGTRGSRPAVYRPPDMYTRHVEHEYWIQRPDWVYPVGHWLELDANGVFQCECKKT